MRAHCRLYGRREIGGWKKKERRWCEIRKEAEEAAVAELLWAPRSTMLALRHSVGSPGVTALE